MWWQEDMHGKKRYRSNRSLFLLQTEVSLLFDTPVNYPMAKRLLIGWKLGGPQGQFSRVVQGKPNRPCQESNDLIKEEVRLFRSCDQHQDKFLIIKPTRCTNFSNLFLEWNSTCFGQFLCTSSGVFHCTHRNGISHTGCWQLACKLSANWNDVYHCCVYSDILLMMDRGTVRNMYVGSSFNSGTDFFVSEWVDLPASWSCPSSK